MKKEKWATSHLTTHNQQKLRRKCRPDEVLLLVGEFLCRELYLQGNEQVAPITFLFALLWHALALYHGERI